MSFEKELEWCTERIKKRIVVAENDVLLIEYARFTLEHIRYEEARKFRLIDKKAKAVMDSMNAQRELDKAKSDGVSSEYKIERLQKKLDEKLIVKEEIMKLQ